MEKTLKSLERIVNEELCQLYDWLSSNKLSLNIKKSNYVIFHPYQKKLAYQPVIKMFNSELNAYAELNCNDHIKYLGVLMDKNLLWKYHVEHVLNKISKTIGMISKLRHFVPKHTLLNIYKSLIDPYLSYCLVIWGQTSKSNWNDILVLQKRVLRFIHFSDKRKHAIPLFVSTNILPINLLYFQHVLVLMHDIKNSNAPVNILNHFQSTSDIHSYNTCSSKLNNFYIKQLKL